MTVFEFVVRISISELVLAGFQLEGEGVVPCRVVDGVDKFI